MGKAEGVFITTRSVAANALDLVHLLTDTTRRTMEGLLSAGGSDKGLSLSLADLWQKLPAEIQFQVWEHVFISDAQICCPHRPFWRDPGKSKRGYSSGQLLRINTDIFTKHLSTFWSHNFFRPENSYSTTLWQPSLPAFADRIQTICGSYSTLGEHGAYASLPNFHGLKRSLYRRLVCVRIQVRLFHGAPKL